MAAGDGVIERASRWGSFGNYIRIRHNGTYKTAYAHLSRYAKGMHPGVRVKQGQIIGYVGMTGGATGPHLHYEVLVNGKQVNAQKLDLPTGRTLAGADLKTFEAMLPRLQAQIAATPMSTQVAANQQ
jgi:murein DD-endopeptidase MepM/ murein hydrolase activator NlpD